MFSYHLTLKSNWFSFADNHFSNGYQTFMQFPRISFAGRFKADAATGNNPSTNFDNENFFSYDSQGEFKGGKSQWNPEGTNNFILLDCHVTTACHIDGKCTEDMLRFKGFSEKDSVNGNVFISSQTTTTN